MAVVARGVAYYRDDFGTGDNSNAEWRALIFAAEIAAQLGARDVIFVGDSALVINQAKGSQKCRSTKLQQHFDKFQSLIANLGRIRLRHVGRSQNLAGIALARRHPRG